MRKAVRISMVFAAAYIISIGPASPQAKLFTNFDPPGSTFTELWGINNWQMLAGNACLSCRGPITALNASWIFDGAQFTFYSDSVAVKDTDGTTYVAPPFRSARSINDSGQVVGFYGTDINHVVGYLRGIPTFDSFTPLTHIPDPPSAGSRIQCSESTIAAK